MNKSQLVVVDGFVATKHDKTNLRTDAWSLALDQRAFGPRQLLVAFATRRGRMLSLAYTRRREPPESGLGPCIQHCGQGAAAAVAYCDERVTDGPPPPEVATRFALAQSICASYKVYLVDWISCDDQLFRSSRLAVAPKGKWWDVPPHTMR